jgi:hypothetical protein
VPDARVATLVMLIVCLFRPMLLLSRRHAAHCACDRHSQHARRSQWKCAAIDRACVRRAGQRDLKSLRRSSFAVSLSSAQRIAALPTFVQRDRNARGKSIEQARRSLTPPGVRPVALHRPPVVIPIGDELLSLRAKSVPIFTVGLGVDRFDKDIEIRRVQASSSVLKGGTLMAELLIRQRGYGGTRVPLVVEDGGRIVSRDSISLPADGDLVARARGRRARSGPRFHVPHSGCSRANKSNRTTSSGGAKSATVARRFCTSRASRDTRCGSCAPRCVEADSNIQKSSQLQRTAENKFLRLSIDMADELASDSQRRAPSCFISLDHLGNMEASFFLRTTSLAMLADFRQRNAAAACCSSADVDRSRKAGTLERCSPTSCRSSCRATPCLIR